MNRSLLWALLAGSVGLGAGLALGLSYRSAATALATPIAFNDPMPHKPATPTTPHRRPPNATKALDSCEDELDAARALLDLQEALLHGIPATFDDVPDALRPHAFQDTLAEGMATCGIGATTVHVDCGEYPCIALFDEHAVSNSLTMCPSWREQFGGAIMMANETLIRGEERVPFQMFAQWPEDHAFPGGDDNFRKRLELRKAELRAEAEEIFDARQINEEEKLLEQRAFWMNALERGEDGAQFFIDKMDAEIEALRESQ